MSSSTDRPTGVVAAAVCLLLTAGLAGCSGVSGPDSSCGPGETTIDSIDGNASDITVEGELTSVNESSLVLDDGTGTAEILLLDPNRSDNFETGDCVVATGNGGESAASPQDIVMIAQNLSTAG